MTHENQNKVKKEGGMFFVGVTMKSCEILKINVWEREEGPIKRQRYQRHKYSDIKFSQQPNNKYEMGTLNFFEDLKTIRDKKRSIILNSIIIETEKVSETRCWV